MKIEYKILWVEDVKSWYDDSRELVSDYLEDEGFILISKLCRGFSDVEREYKLNQLKEYDLLLVDFTLAGSPNGDEIIKFVREQKDNPILTDVLFYSSDIEAVRDSIKKYDLEGVYTSARKDFIDKIERVIDTTIKKVQEVNSMRGLIMAETSDLDDLMLDITKKALKTDIASALEQYIGSEIENTMTSLEKMMKEDIPITDKINNSRIFTSFHKAKCINKLYKLTVQSGNPIGEKNFFQRYQTDVISTRNNFAHVKESIENGERVLVSHLTDKREIFNEERCSSIRKNLIKYRDLLEEINKQLD